MTQSHPTGFIPDLVPAAGRPGVIARYWPYGAALLAGMLSLVHPWLMWLFPLSLVCAGIGTLVWTRMRGPGTAPSYPLGTVTDLIGRGIVAAVLSAPVLLFLA